MNLTWTGTDSLMLIDISKRKLIKRPYWIAFRLLVRILDKWFIGTHTVKNELMRSDLVRFNVTKPILREQYNLPNSSLLIISEVNRDQYKWIILYYYPKTSDDKFTRWLYGIDLIERLQQELNTTFFRVDGSSDMGLVYGRTKLLLRPNRHDGYSRMIKECNYLNIPYYWSTSNPDYETMKAKVNEYL